MKNLLFITNKFPPLGCGVGDYTYHLAKEFVKNGHKVSVICKTDHTIKDYWQNHDEGFKVYPIGGNWQRRDWQLVLENIQQINPNTVLFQYVPGSYDRHALPWQLFYFYRKLHKLPVKIVTTFHEVYVRYNWSHPKYLYMAIAQRLIARFVAKNSHQLVTSIDRYEQQLKRWNPNVTIIPVGSNILPISVSPEEIETIRRKIAPSGEAVLCTFGKRDHQPLLELFQEVVSRKPDTVLLIIGKLNANLEALPEAVRKKVHSTGFLEADEVYRHLKASDAFIMFDPIGEKGNGGTCNKSGSLAAAFAAGLPIFATKGDMTNKLLIQESALIFISFRLVETSAKKISELLMNQKELNLNSKFSFNFFNNYLSPENFLAQYEQIIN